MSRFLFLIIMGQSYCLVLYIPSSAQAHFIEEHVFRALICSIRLNTVNAFEEQQILLCEHALMSSSISLTHFDMFFSMPLMQPSRTCINHLPFDMIRSLLHTTHVHLQSFQFKESCSFWMSSMCNTNCNQPKGSICFLLLSGRQELYDPCTTCLMLVNQCSCFMSLIIIIRTLWCQAESIKLARYVDHET